MNLQEGSMCVYGQGMGEGEGQLKGKGRWEEKRASAQCKEIKRAT